MLQNDKCNRSADVFRDFPSLTGRHALHLKLTVKSNQQGVAVQLWVHRCGNLECCLDLQPQQMQVVHSVKGSGWPSSKQHPNKLCVTLATTYYSWYEKPCSSAATFLWDIFHLSHTGQAVCNQCTVTHHKDLPKHFSFTKFNHRS